MHGVKMILNSFFTGNFTSDIMGATFLELLITVLTASIKKHGSKPLTTLHFLNMCKMCLRIIQKDSEKMMKTLKMRTIRNLEMNAEIDRT
jgi:hypothetical protein